METRFTVLLIEIGVAIVVQIGILAAMLATVRRSSKRMEALVAQVEQRALPALDSTRALLESSRPAIEEMLKNASAASATVRQQVERAEGTFSEVLERARLQVMRADALVTQALDRVEGAASVVSSTVASPARQVAGVFQGVATGVSTFFGSRRARPRPASHHEDMFI